MRKTSHGISAVAALGVSGFLFYFAMRGVRVSEIREVLSGANIRWLPMLLVMPVLDLWIRAVRWRRLLYPVAAARVGTLFQLEAVGLALNNLLFLRVGEVARVFIAGKELGVPFVSVLASIVVERLCDTTALLTLFALSSLVLGPVVDPRLRAAALAAAAGGMILLGLLAAADRAGEDAWWARRLRKYPRVRLRALEVTAGSRALRSVSGACEIAILSLSLWVCDAGTFWAAGHVLGLDPSLSYLYAISVVASAAAASALPAMPGAFGNFEAAVQYVLMRFGYSKQLAISFAVISHLSMYIVVTVTGVVSLFALGYTVANLRDSMRRK